MGPPSVWPAQGTPLYLGVLPPPHPPSSGTNTHVPTLLPHSTGSSSTPHQSPWGRGLEGPQEKRHGSTHPQAHLLVEIVVKQDQVEVSLQAPQRPLLDTGLAATSLRGGDQEAGQGSKDAAPQPPFPDVRESSLRGAQRTIYLSPHNTVLPAPFAVVNPWCRERCWSLCQALLFSVQGLPLPQTVPEIGWGSPLCRPPHPPCRPCTTVLKQQMYKHFSLNQRPLLKNCDLPPKKTLKVLLEGCDYPYFTEVQRNEVICSKSRD